MTGASRIAKPEDKRAAADWVIATGRKSTTEAAEHFGWDERYASSVMSAAQSLGIHRLRLTGGWSVWATAAEAEEFAAGSKARELAMQRVRDERRRQSPQAVDADDSVDCWPVVRRIVKASDAGRISVSAPNSVFALGATA